MPNWTRFETFFQTIKKKLELIFIVLDVEGFEGVATKGLIKYRPHKVMMEWKNLKPQAKLSVEDGSRLTTSKESNADKITASIIIQEWTRIKSSQRSCFMAPGREIPRTLGRQARLLKSIASMETRVKGPMSRGLSVLTTCLICAQNAGAGYNSQGWDSRNDLWPSNSSIRSAQRR
jgi:hypothetical protein